MCEFRESHGKGENDKHAVDGPRQNNKERQSVHEETNEDGPDIPVIRGHHRNPKNRNIRIYNVQTRMNDEQPVNSKHHETNEKFHESFLRLCSTNSSFSFHFSFSVSLRVSCGRSQLQHIWKYKDKAESSGIFCFPAEILENDIFQNFKRIYI